MENNQARQFSEYFAADSQGQKLAVQQSRDVQIQMRQDTYCPVVASEAASAGDEVTNDMSLEESFPELRVQTGLHVR